jgi:hypothetical protein
MALLFIWHLEDNQQHPTSNWLKGFAEHPLKVLGIDDARHWAERMMGMLCMQVHLLPPLSVIQRGHIRGSDVMCQLDCRVPTGPMTGSLLSQ